MKHVIIVVSLFISSKAYCQEFDGICRLTTENKQWSGVLIEQGVLTVSHPQEENCVAIFDDGTYLIGTKCRRLKENKLADIALYDCQIPNYVRVKRHSLKKASKDVKIIGYVGLTRVIRTGQFSYHGTVDGYPIVGYNCEATSGMSGSPVFGDGVTGIQFGGVKTSTATVSYETIQEFLK